MKRSNLFSATRLSDLPGLLIKKYGSDKGGRIFARAESILVIELAGINDRGNKTIGKYIRHDIIPGYACYRAMLDEGICSFEAVEFIKSELCKSAERMVSLCKRLGSKRYAYRLIRLLMRPILNYGYPKAGWTVIMHEDNKDRIRFDMTSCLYCDELEKRNALELCPAFCHIDVVSYAPLAPAVIFSRNFTLAQTGQKCDFCFENGLCSNRNI